MVTKGEIPITKNVVVTDEYGKQIGFTYPRRVKGLIKNGRAEYVNDCTIRLTHASSVIHENTEDLIMSNVIDFNAREFCFDSAIENQAGTRKYVTDSSGSSCEVFEIGDWCWSWSQIRCTKCLQPDADYVFRFAMTGGFNDTQDAISQFIIFYDEQWDDRYVYSLARSEFKPMFSKCCDGQLLRVYEIPFHTGNNRETTFMFVAQHAVACFMPAREADYYAGMEDLDYATWWEEHRNLLESRQQSNGENSMEGCKGTDGEYNFHSEGKQNVAIDLSGAIMSRGTLEKLLEVVKYRDGKIDLSGTVINDD